MPASGARTVVITGASAGVGRATARVFARHGWRVALIARDQAGLESACREIEQAGGTGMAISADVADADAVFAAADKVAENWQAIDVWVNNAMATIFSPVSDISPEEFRRATEVTYLSYVFGTMAALRHMRRRAAGTIVQVGSALSYRAIPLQSAYCGAKFAIRGFTDALRSELQHERSGIRVTMVQLPAVNTPQFDWARNKLGFRAQPMPPIHQPEPAAEAIFRASQRAPREAWVGFASVKVIIGNMVLPGLLDRFLARTGFGGQITSEPKPADDEDNLFKAVVSGHTAHGRFDDRARTHVFSYNAAFVRGLIAVGVLGVVVICTAFGTVILRWMG